MAGQDVGQGQPRWPWLDVVAWLSVAGAIVSLLSIQLPWARIEVASTPPGLESPKIFWAPMDLRLAIFSLLSARFGEQAYRLSVDITFLWATTLASGVVLALAMTLWRRSRLAGTVYLVWLALVTAGMALIAYSVFGRPPQAFCDVSCDYTVILARVPTSGPWLNTGALTLIWVGGGARLASLRRVGVRVGRFELSSALRSLLSPARMGALIATLGILIWFFGYIFTPWATQGCTGFPVNWSHFVSGACAGLDSDEVLVYATPSGFANGSYLGLGVTAALLAMLVALIAVWQRGWIPLVISLIWAAFATWLTALAISGFPGMFQHPHHLNSSTAPWVAGYGPAVSVTGLVILWAGLAELCWRWYLNWRASQSQQLIQSESAGSG